MISPHSTGSPRRLALVAALVALAGCYEGNEAPEVADTPHPDAAPDPGDGGIGPPDADGADAATPDAGPMPCAADEDCPGYCAADRICRPAAERPVFAWPADGLVRAGAARFDLAPGYLEPWSDRAGPDCPENRPGVFDGDRLTPAPADPCRDGFDDADGDGVLDAVWLAGFGLDRPARGIDERRPPEGRVVLLTRDRTAYLLVTLDVYAVDTARLAELVDRVARRIGLPASAIAVHATGTRTGPDAVGLWGPSLSASGEAGARALRDALDGRSGLLGEMPQQSGVDAGWWAALPSRVAAAARQAAAAAGPVSVRHARAALPVEAPRFEGSIALPDADADGVANDGDDLAAWRAAPPPLAWDERLPGAVDAAARIVSLDAVDTGRPRVLLAGWSAAPAAAPRAAALLDADHPGAVRARLEAAFPEAIALWLTGAAADTFRAGAGAFVPAMHPDGGFAGPDGQPVDALDEAAPADDPPDALGALITERLLAALAEAPPAPAALSLSQRFAWVPITNPRVGVAARLGLLPHLRDWLRRRVPTDAWVDGANTPACGGLGCLRYRLDLLDLGPVALLTTPGALDRAYVDGRLDTRLPLGDGRNLDDLDLDGLPDARDDDIRFTGRAGDVEVMVTVAGPANPQRFPAIGGLGGEGLWIIGRTNGGLGSLRGPVEFVDAFEGQLEPLAALAAQDPGRPLCGSSHPCAGALTIGELVERTRAAQPALLADIPGSRELRLASAPPPGGPHPWRIEAPDGAVRAEGERLVLGPRDRAFTTDVDLVAAGVQPGDRLVLTLAEPGFAMPHVVAEVVPIELRRHPNIGDTWRAVAPAGGDLVYNTACELLYAGPCPTRRAVLDDPNVGLPRTP